MGVFGQLGALLRKNFLIRKRHPTFLVLEILWPVLLFVALALMRLGFPPDHRKTCEYPERALPGAGLVPFLQSSICTLDNNCSERSWISERQQAQLRFQAMIQEIDPLLTKPTTVEAFRSLPTVIVVLNSIKDVVNGTTIDKIDQKLVLRNMFRDPEEVVNILSDKYKILERRVASALLDSSLNAVALVSGIGMVDFKGIVCDPDELEKYIILSDKNNEYVVNKYSVSTSLCRIADDKISEITSDLVRQLDVANIIRLAQVLANVTGSFDTATLFEDIANLVDMYMDSSSVLALLSNVPDLGVLPDIIRQMAKIVPMLNDLADIDFANIGAILDLVSPLVKLLTNDTMLIDAQQTAMTSAANMMSSLKGNMDPASLLENMPELTNMTGMLYGLGLPGVTYSAPFSQVGDLYNFFAGNMSKDDISSLSMNDTLDFVEGLMRSLYSNETADLMMAMATNTMEMVKDVQVFYEGIESELKYAVTNSDAVKISLNKLGEAGPDVAYTFMAEIVTFENFYSLMSGETTAKRLCENAVTVAYQTVPGYDHSTTVATVCSQAATQMIDQVFVNNSFSELTGKLEVHMSDMDSMMVQGVIPAHQDIMSMTDMYYEMQTTINELMTTSNSDLPYIAANTTLDYWGDYNWVWNNIAERYNYQAMLLPVMIVGRAAENSPMWQTVFSPTMEISDAILSNAVHRIKLFEDMNVQDKIITKVFKYLTYYPDIVESAVGQNISKLVKVLGQNDTAELSRMLCEDTQWSTLDVQAEISVEDMRQFVCTTNLTKLVEDIWNIADPMSFLNDVETDVQENLETGIKWSRMASYIQYMYETFTGDNSIMELLTTVFQTDFSRIMSYYTMMENYITKLTMQGITSDMENAYEMEMSLQSLDKALESWDLWKRVKHYVRTWTLMAKILNEIGQLTSDPNLDIIAYVEGISPTLGKYFSNATSTMPEILGAIQDSVTKPQQIVERLLGIDFMGFCDDPKSISLLLGIQSTPDIEQFQNGLCQLNWTAILEEMEEDDSNWSSFFIQWRMILTYDTASLPPISLNWTDVITTTQKFMENANTGMFNNFMPDLYNFGLNGVNASISNLTSALQNTWMLNTQQLVGSIDQLTMMLLDLPGGNDTFAEMWKLTMAMQSYITYHFFTFINIHLDIINSTRTLNIQAHVNSAEADKLFMLMQKSPEANAVLLYNMRKLAGGMPGEWLSIDFMNMCNDTSKLESALEIPADANITKMEVIDAVCAAVDFDKLWMEIRAGVPGLQELLDALDKAFSTNVTTADLMVNYTATSLVIERYSALLTDILESDIQLVGLPLMTEGELNRLMEQFNDFPMEILADWNTTDPLQLLQNSQNQTLQSLKGLQDVPGMREVIVVAEMYMQVLNAMVTQSDAILMDPAAGFQGYPEMYKMWQMMEWLPQLYTTFIYTSLVDNHKISFLVETLTMGGPEAMCQKDPAALITNPPFMNIQFANFYNLFCSVNFTLLQDEVMVFIQQKKIADTYSNLGNLTDAANIEALMSEYERLSKAVEQFISKTSELKIPGFDNLTIWEKATEFLGNVSMERTNITALQYSQNMTLQMLKGLENIPRMKEVIVVAEVYMQVLNTMVTQSDAILMDPVAGFQGYSEMYKMWQMIEWLPQLYTTFIYTSLVDNHKISFFVETLTIGGPEALCQKDPAALMTNPPYMNIQFADFYNLFCSVNLTLLQDEMMVFIQQKKISDTYGNLGNLTDTADIEALMSEYERLSKAVEQFISKTSEFKIPGFDNLTIWEKATEFLGNVSMERTNITALQYSQNMTLQMLKGLENIPRMKEVIVVAEVYMQVLNAMVTQSDAMFMDPVAGFQGYPEMYKMWQMMEWLPQLYTTFIYTSLVDNHKISFFVETLTMGGPEALCQKDPAALLTNPPYMNIQFADFYSLFCSVNFTLLQDEVMVFIQQKKISDTYGNLGNLTDTADIEALMSEYERLSKAVEQFISKTSEFKIPGFDNLTIWEKATEFLGNVSMERTNITALQYSQNVTLQMLMGLENIPSMKEVIVVVEVYMQVLNAMVTQSDAMFMDPVAGFKGYPEMYKMWQMMEWLPQLYTTFIYTSLVDNHKITFLVETIVMGGPEALCEKAPAVLMTNPPFMNIQFADFYNLFCSVNFTLLQDEVMVFIQQKKISDTYGNLGNLTDTADIEAVMSEYERLSKAIEQFASKTPEFKIPGFENFALWEKAMEFLGNVSMDYANVTALQYSQNQTLQTLRSLETVPGMKEVIVVAEVYMQVLNAMATQSEAMFMDPVAGFQGYPEMYKMWQMMEWLPQLYTTFIYTSLVDNHKISFFVETVVMGGPEALCQKDPVALMTNPPFMNIQFADFYNLFCSVNFTLLQDEVIVFIQQKKIADTYGNLGNLTDTADIDALMSEYESLSKVIEQFAKKTPEFKIPGFENLTLWEKAMEFLGNVSMDMATLNAAVNSTDGLLEMLSSLSPEFQNQLKILQITYHVLERMLDRLENMSGDSYKLEDFFYGYGEMQRILIIMQETGVMDMLAASLNTPQFTKLLENTNATAVLEEVCSGNISAIITVPPSATVNLTDVRDRFCKINFDVLMQEFADAFFINEVMNMMSDNQTVSWKSVTQQNARITERLQNWLANPPMVDIPELWKNGTYWLELLNLMNNNNQAPAADNGATMSLNLLLEDIEKYLGTEYTELINAWTPVAVQLGALLEMDENAKKTFATIDIFLGYMVDRLSNVSDNYTIEALSKNSTDIVRFMQALQDLKDTSGAGYDSLNDSINQDKLYKVLLDPETLMKMCDNDSVAAYVAANDTATRASRALEEVICFDTNTWLQVLQDQVKLNMFEEKLTEIWNSPNVNLNWTSLSNNTQMFLKLLLGMIQSPPSPSHPLQQWASWDDMISFLSKAYMDPNILMNLINNINPLVGTEMNNLTNAFNKLLMPFIKQLQGGNIEEIFTNPEKLLSIIQSMASLDDWLDVTSAVIEAATVEAKPTRESILGTFVCQESELAGYRDYLSYSLTMSPDYIMYLCAMNVSSWDSYLLSRGYSVDDVNIINGVFARVVDAKMQKYEEGRNTVNMLQDVMKQLKTLNLDMLIEGYHWMDWIMSVQSSRDSFEDMLSLMEMLGDASTVMEFKRSLLVIVEIQDYINMMLNKLQGNESIPITDILPSSASVSRLLEYLTSSGTVSSLTLAYVNPAKFVSLLFTGEWHATFCNMTLFLETFTFPPEVNVTMLQHQLCSEFVAQKEDLDKVMKSLNLETIIRQIENILNNETAHADNETWAYMETLVERLARNLAALENVSITGWDDWIQPVLKSLEDLMNNTQDDGIVDTCDRVFALVKDTPVYMDWIQPYLNSVHSFLMISHSVMTIQLKVDEAVCKADDKNITRILNYLKENGLSEEISRLSDYLSMKAETEFDCSSYPKYSNFFATLSSSLTSAFDGPSNIVQCVTDSVVQAQDLIMDISKLFSIGSDISSLLQDDNLRAMLAGLLGSNESLAMLDEVLNLYNMQEQAIQQLEDALRANMTDITAFLQGILGNGTDVIFQALNVTYLKNIQNLTASELIDSLCMSDSSLVLADPTLKSSLCGNDTKLSKQVADSLLEYAKTVKELQNLAEYDSDAFWEKIMTDLSKLIGNIEGLSSLTRLIDRLGEVDIFTLSQDKELLRTIKELLVDNGPDDILANLNLLLDNFRVLDDSNLTHAILDDVRTLADGVFAFTSLRNMFLTNVKITELVKDPVYLRDYIINLLSFLERGEAEAIADAILDGSLSIETLFAAAELDISGWICNSTQLEELLVIKNTSGINATDVSERFCSLDTNTLSAVVDEVLAQLDIGNLMEDLINNGMGAILRKSNISMANTKASIKNLVNTNQDLRQITKKFNEFSATIPDAFASLAQAQTGNQEFGSLSAILCGNALPIISDEFGTGAVLKTADLTDSQRKEMESLPGKSCRDMFVKIMQDGNGPIIWAYLKPLLRGKILFTPDTPEVREIINKINTTFASLEEFIALAIDWAEGSVALGNLTGKNARDLQDLLSSKVIKSMMTQVAGVDASSLDDVLYTLEDTDMEMMEGISKVAKMIKDYVSCLELDRFEGYETENDMEIKAANYHRRNELLAGVVFGTSPNGFKRKKRQAATIIPKHIHYTIRMDLDNVPDTRRIKQRMWRPQPNDDFISEMRYFRGFTQLQDMIDEAIISLHVGPNVTLPTTTTNQFPFPCHTLDLFVNTIAGYLLNVLMTLSWLAAICVAVYNLVYDRERGQEETLNAMGLKYGLNWIAWFFSTMLVMALVCLIDAIILKYGKIFTKSDMGIVYLYFLDFIFSTIMLCYFVSAFFTRTSLAILASIIVYLVSYLPFVVLYTLEVDMTFWQKTLACLSSTTAFSYAAQYIARYEEQQVGLNWDNIDKDPIYNDGFSFSWCCIMIIIDAGIYLIFGWYVRNVKPGKFGVSEPWYFPFKPSYWCCCSGEEERYAPSDSGIFAEEVKSDVPVVMSARGLSKTFSDGTKAVKNLSLDIHAGNVTTLLGHNGAAKTTTMNMLTGILEPSKGCVQILNRPLRSMRGSVGICSQHNALYDYMTVKEHMHFYSSMKEGSYHGLSAKDEVRQLLKDVDLYYCRNMLVKQLSGGMQRRLCVALAFIGGSKVVILDEPTSGVDPSGRRAVWNLIIRKKSGTAVLLSTHHLDEADIISDQIAIMHEGKLLCQGSPMFLKHHLASGHRLTITKINTDTDPVPVLTLIKRWIPGVKLESTAGAEMNFVLPAATEAEFYGLFRELDEEKQALNIESYGISDPKLEEVFLKVCSAADIGRQITPDSIKNIDDAEGANGANGDSNGDWKHDFEHSGGSNERLSKKSAHRASPVSQFGAILVKRFHHYRRDWRILLSVLVLPLLLFLLATGIYRVKPGATSQPSIYLSPAMYGPNSRVFMQPQSSLNLDNKIVNTFMVDPGIGTSCMTVMTPGKPYRCVTPDRAFSVPPANTTSGQCTCNNNEYRCMGSPYGVPPPQRVTTTTDILQDLDGRDINLYLLDSYPEFIQKRYGGWSFDDTMENLKINMKSKIWYDNQGYHALPAFMNAYSNGLLRALVNDSSKAPEYGISIYNHPFMFGKERLSKDSIVQHAADMGIAIMILLAFTFVPVGVLLYSVSENVSKEKHMQFVSGVGTFTYWISSLFWDVLVQGVAVSVAVIIIVIFKPDSFWAERNLEATVVLLLLYGWSTITLAYFLVKRFQTSGAAFFTLFCSLMFLGIICVIILFAFNFFQSNSKSLKKTYEVIQYVFLIFPPYALVGGLLELTDNQIQTEIFLRFNVNVYKDPFSFPMVAWNMIAMAIAGFVFLVLTLWLDTRCCCSRRYECSVKENQHDDSDVVEERHRIDRGDCRQDVVVVRNLHKIYTSNRKEVHAVNGLSFGVPSGQCFGLLGMNGAGKTSTFNILTGQQHSSAGSCSILGHVIEPGASQIGKQMGYCPQEDALDPYLSVISTLYFHAKLKGLTGSTRKQAVDKVLSKLELNKIQNKIVKACSGGMKRKLSLGIALLGDPAVVLLDEPTSGMDPKAKRLVWNCLLEAKRNGQAIILTSHSLEECDILCDRIGIMVNGEFKCLGSSQHLKQKYGDGYTVTLSVSGLSTSMSRIYELIQKHFPTASIRDQHLNVIQLDIPRDSVRIADMFAILEREKSNFNIVYYTVSQTTLDTIFLNFARDQTDGENLEVSDVNSASSDRDNSSDSTPSSAVANPYYSYTNPSLSLAGDKDKRPASTAYDAPYILPAKNSFSDGDADSVSYSTRL